MTSVTVTEANKGLVRELYGSLMAKGDVAAADQLLGAGYVDHDIPGHVGPGDGPALKAAVLGVRASFPDIRPELYELVAEGEWVGVRVEASGRHTGAPFLGIPAAGRSIRWKELHLFRCVAGKIVEHRGVFDVMSILAQLGAAGAAP